MGMIERGDPYALSDITDHDLDQMVGDVKKSMPYIGIRMVWHTQVKRCDC